MAEVALFIGGLPRKASAAEVAALIGGVSGGAPSRCVVIGARRFAIATVPPEAAAALVGRTDLSVRGRGVYALEQLAAAA